MSRYWFVRHGESVANAERWLAGHRDVGLTDTGKLQAWALKKALADVQPERVVTSDLLRVVQTAAIAWDHRLPPAQRAEEVRERHLGEWEGARFDELERTGGMDVLLSWSEAPPGGESHLDLARRALGFLASIDDGKDLLLFGHGGWIRAVVGLIDGIPHDLIGRYKVANTEIIQRDVAQGTWAELRARFGVGG